MSEQSLKSFLAQFSESKQRIEEWPSWMRDSAKVATASFPKPAHTAESDKRKAGRPIPPTNK
jgi:hypothetical protein